MCEHCTRREFLGTGVGSGLMLAGASWTHAWASQSPPAQPMGKSRKGKSITKQIKRKEKAMNGKKQKKGLKKPKAWTDEKL